jgi:serine/threonine-protein kinase HipA
MRRGRSVETVGVRLDLGGEIRAVGTLAWSVGRRLAAFQYDAAFLESGLQVSPLTLPLGPELRFAPRMPFEGLHGVFADSLPDGWGRLLVDRQVRKAGGDPAALSPLDRLTLVGGRGMGALRYEPETFSPREALGVDLDAMARDAEAILEGDDDVDVRDLVDANGGSAGARPKVMVLRDRVSGHLRLDVGQTPKDSEDAWLIKFRSQSDPADAGVVEHAYALMARDAGIDFPATTLVTGGRGTPYFAAMRFDRTPSGARHVHTLSGLVAADHRAPSVEYSDLLKVVAKVTRDAGQVEEAFRRMVFNVMAGNRDDHAKNHALLMGPDGRWTLTPAYDVCPSAGPGGEHAMAINGEGRSPTSRDVMAVARDAGMDGVEARAIVEGVAAATEGWSDRAREAGVPRKRADAIGRMLSTNASLARGSRRTRGPVVPETGGPGSR